MLRLQGRSCFYNAGRAGSILDAQRCLIISILNLHLVVVRIFRERERLFKIGARHSQTSSSSSHSRSVTTSFSLPRHDSVAMSGSISVLCLPLSLSEGFFSSFLMQWSLSFLATLRLELEDFLWFEILLRFDYGYLSAKNLKFSSSIFADPSSATFSFEISRIGLAGVVGATGSGPRRLSRSSSASHMLKLSSSKNSKGVLWHASIPPLL